MDLSAYYIEYFATGPILSNFYVAPIVITNLILSYKKLSNKICFSIMIILMFIRFRDKEFIYYYFVILFSFFCKLNGRQIFKNDRN